jgi:predicted dehydrogenase
MVHELRLGAIGCGEIARDVVMLGHYTRRMKVTALCDLDAIRMNRLARRFGRGNTYSDYREMLEQGDLDAVYVAVPHHLHHEIICAALKKRVAVLAEKPITRTLQEGIEVARMAEEAGVPLGVNYQYRYDRGCFALARHVQKGTIGRVLYARINLPWHRERDYFEGAAWHKTIAQAGGGTLITQASHLIDAALWALGSKPVSVVGVTAKKVFTDVEVEDTALGMIELADGCLVQVCSSMVANPEGAVSIECYGEKGTAFYTNRPFPRARFTGVKAGRVPLPYFGVHAVHRSLKGFRDWVLEGEPFLIPAREALPALAVVEAFYRSAASDQREPVAAYE